MISKEDIIQTAHMCKLKLRQEEVDKYISIFTDILEKAMILNDIDRDGTEAMDSTELVDKPLREDLAGDSLDREEVLKNAPQQEYGYFKLLSVMD